MKSSKCPKSSQSLPSTSSPLTLTQTKKTFPHPHSLLLSLQSPKNPPTSQPQYSSTRTSHLLNLTPFTFLTLSVTSTEHFQTTPVTANKLPIALESGPWTLFSPNLILPTATINWWDLRLSNSLVQSRLSNKPSRTYRNQTKSNNRTSNNSYPEWNPAGSVLGDAPHHPTSPPIFLCHLCIFLLIVTSPRWSALAAPILESNDHVT